jgi:hypothetical protein|tara:strand:+ start:319 stop:534 length:216 start_codon:yes stop_codon:yes gene_type:complete
MYPDATFVEVLAFTGRLALQRADKIRDHIHALECSDDALYLNKSKVCEIDTLNAEIKRLGLLETMIGKWFT